MPPTRSRAGREPQTQKPRNDVYVGLLIISFLAMIAGTVILYLDYAALEEKPKAPPAKPAAQAPPAPAGATQTAPVVPMPMPMPPPMP